MMMSSMIMQSGYYFSLKCKTGNISNEEGGRGFHGRDFLGLEKAIDLKHLQRSRAKKKKSTARTGQQSNYFTSLGQRGVSGLW